MKCNPRIVAFLAHVAVAARSHAEFIEYQENFAGWQAAAGSYSTITFEGFPDATKITDQYAALGVTFTSLDLNTTVGPDPSTFPQDGWGLDGNSYVELTFSQPITTIGWHFPGILKAVFYLDATVVGVDIQSGGAGASHFTGFTGDVLFNRVRIFRDNFPQGSVGLDNLYIQTIPAPGAGAVLAAAACGLRRRRRR